jgi:hypothetical protein
MGCSLEIIRPDGSKEIIEIENTTLKTVKKILALGDWKKFQVSTASDTGFSWETDHVSGWYQNVENWEDSIKL